jgi:hypothetical protein
MIKALGGEAVMKLLLSLQIPTSTLIFQLTGVMSGLDLPSIPAGGASDELHNRLIEIIDDITSARDKMIPIRQLHAIQRQYPGTDIHVYLQKISAAFRRFVLDTLVKLDELDRAQEVYESSIPSIPDQPRASQYDSYRAGRTSPPAYQLPINVSTTTPLRTCLCYHIGSIFNRRELEFFLSFKFSILLHLFFYRCRSPPLYPFLFSNFNSYHLMRILTALVFSLHSISNSHLDRQPILFKKSSEVMFANLTIYIIIFDLTSAFLT